MFQASDPRPYALELQGLRDSPSPTTRPFRDPTNSFNRHKLDLGVEPSFIFARIVDYVAQSHCYKCQLSRGGPIIMATDLTHTSLQITGASSIATYSPGTGVFLLYHPQSTVAFILGCLPDFSYDPTIGLSDLLVQGSNVGLRSDVVHTFPFSFPQGGNIEDRSARRPFDSLSGEWGAMSELGVGVLVDSFMAYLRADEETGFFAFYHDQLARMAGHNLELRSSGHVRTEYDDQNEFDGVSGWSPYLFEARGAFYPNKQVFRELGAADAQQQTPWYSAYEPFYDDQLAFNRRSNYTGYLGQGGASTVAVPPIGVSQNEINRLSVPQIFPGVFEEGVGLDGSVAIRSAKGIFISKRPLIPLPKQQKLPDDPTGDTDLNYKAAGIYGDGPDQLVHDLPQPTVGGSASRAAGIMDLYDFTYNWQAWRSGFQYHTLDWYLPQESAMPMAGNMQAGIPFYGNLSASQYLPAPAPFTMAVDERYGNVMYFPNNSLIALMEDGGLMFVDGWGSEILMSAGSIRLSCAGDVFAAPGRNFNVWSGYDTEIKANNCVDISANQGSIRTKAQQQHMAVAGNGGCGGFLFESRAATGPGYTYDPNNPISNGFNVRCPASPVVMMGQDMLLTTRYPVQGNHIVIDAGTAKTILNGEYVEAQATEAVTLITGGAVHEFWNGYVTLTGDTSVDGKIVVSNCGLFGTSVAAPQVAANLNIYDGTTSAIVSTAVADIATRESALASYAIVASLDVTELVTTAPALPTVQFEWRDAPDYLTEGFVYYESRWQQVARLTGQGLPGWVESASVDAFGNRTMPYPGISTWTAEDSYATQNLNIHDQVTDIAQDRGSLYETATYAVPEFITLNGNYSVISNAE